MIEQYIIYDHPSDFPYNWVVRRRQTKPGWSLFDTHAEFFDDPESAREHIHTKLTDPVCVQGPGDDVDPVIYEVWM